MAVSYERGTPVAHDASRSRRGQASVEEELIAAGADLNITYDVPHNLLELERVMSLAVQVRT